MSRKQSLKSGARSSNVGNHDRTRESREPERNMWSSMLDSVSSGKKLPEKNLIVLGKMKLTEYYPIV